MIGLEGCDPRKVSYESCIQTQSLITLVGAGCKPHIFDVIVFKSFNMPDSVA